VLLRQSAQLHDPSDHVAVNATYNDRSRASKHYYQRTNCRFQTLEATKLVDTEPQAILDVHCTTTKEGSDARSVRNSPVGSRASCVFSPPTKAMTVSSYVRNFERWGYDR
jgi:hypothetical protein